MGVFNLKCAITNKTINYGDDAAVLTLTKKRFRDDSIMIYNNDMYDFNTLPVFGQYNDYGGLENIQSTVGLKDVLNHSKQDINMDPHMNEDHINEIMQSYQLMHIRRDIYDHMMSTQFANKIFTLYYRDYPEFHTEENISQNADTIKPIIESWMKYKQQLDNDPKNVDLLVAVQDVSKLNNVSYGLFEKDGLEIPRCLELYNSRRAYIQFFEAPPASIDESFDKHAQIQHLDNVLSTLGVKLIPTLYGSQDNTSDILWDDIYDQIPKTILDTEY